MTAPGVPAPSPVTYSTVSKGVRFAVWLLKRSVGNTRGVRALEAALDVLEREQYPAVPARTFDVPLA